jgi:hypothetical protein
MRELIPHVLSVVAGIVTTLYGYRAVAQKFSEQIGALRAELADVKAQLIGLARSSVTREQHDQSARDLRGEINDVRERVAKLEARADLADGVVR